MPYLNAPIHPILRLIYGFFKLTSRAFIGLFFREKVLIGKENLRFDGPAIIVVNHPSTLMDVLTSGIRIHQVMYFLANYSLFKHPVSNWVFTRLYCIPVKRREDVGDGVPRDNSAAFEKSFEHLEKNGVLFIAAEGVSWINRFVRPFKTGAARISFGTEDRNGWEKGVKIVTIGLSYSAPHLFRSRVVVEAGVPLSPLPWKEKWLQDDEKAVDDFTQHIENTVRGLCIDARDEAGEKLLAELETIADGSAPLEPKDDYLRSKKIAQNCLLNEDLKSLSEAYFSKINEIKVTDAGLLAHTHPRATVRALRDGLFLMVGLPLFLAGQVYWFLPCFLPWLLNRQLKLYIGYSSTVKVMAGLITFPLAAWGVFKLAFLLTGQTGYAWAILAALILSGFFIEKYLDVYKRFTEQRRAAKKVSDARELLSKRTAVWHKLEPMLREANQHLAVQ
ncbi:MAG: 1-acyl-sn-glycerol-3-phosphate acyltransferase [Saprospiraceae bacterium]|nr:1-acyl-sn-glycerol-3-phosphate acyltransferase [Saprospiraceae bacterium]